VSWVAVGYVLAFASVLPVFARLAEIAGRKVLYLSGFALFALGRPYAASRRACQRSSRFTSFRV
jgi:MFS family permease